MYDMVYHYCVAKLPKLKLKTGPNNLKVIYHGYNVLRSTISTYTHTPTHIYIYIYICVCVCVCVYLHKLASKKLKAE